MAYVVHFKCNKKAIHEYPNLFNYSKDIFQIPGMSSTVDMEHIKKHYYGSITRGRWKYSKNRNKNWLKHTCREIFSMVDTRATNTDAKQQNIKATRTVTQKQLLLPLLNSFCYTAKFFFEH